MQAVRTTLVRDGSLIPQYRIGMGGMEDAREAKGWSRAELAVKINVKEATVYRYEKDQRNIPTARVSQIAIVLGVAPTVIKPRFGREVVASLSPDGQRKFFDHLETLYLAERAGKS